MPEAELGPKSNSILSTVARFGWVGVIVALLSAGWTVYSRHESEVQAVRIAEASKQAGRERQAKLIFGSGEVKIVSYSVDKASLARGESADLCYGVINATKVTLEPHVEDSKPSAYHCLTIAPRTTTTYTLTAANDQGQTKSLSVTVRVH
jgi:hypothetical protein